MLLPLSWIYSAAVWIRNMLYDEHILVSHSVSVPTIVVGNLAVGGTGKTPFVEHLIRLLGEQYHVAVLSRGYGRKSHGFVLANESCDALALGDEPWQIHHKFPHIPLAVCADRIHGIKRLMQLCPEIDVILLDDALQYRRLQSGMNILLTGYDNLYIRDCYLPAGSLRDHVSQALRANLIVVTHCPPKMQPIDKRVVNSELHLYTWQHLYFSRVQYPQIPRAHHALLLTGIASSTYLEQYVRSCVENLQVLRYQDHHWYTHKDIQVLEKKAAEVDYIFTTEKDMARLTVHTLSEDLKAKLYPIPICLSLDEQSDMLKALQLYINERIRK